LSPLISASGLLTWPQGGEGLEKLKGKTITAPAVLEKEPA
jgi:hypothetical protein